MTSRSISSTLVEIIVAHVVGLASIAAVALGVILVLVLVVMMVIVVIVVVPSSVTTTVLVVPSLMVVVVIVATMSLVVVWLAVSTALAHYLLVSKSSLTANILTTVGRKSVSSYSMVLSHLISLLPIKECWVVWHTSGDSRWHTGIVW